MDAGLESGTVKPRTWRRVTVETTVPDQAVTFPTDRKRLNRSQVRRVRRCRQHGVGWRQRDARQFRRLNRPTRCLRTYLGRVVADELAMARPLRAQEKKGRNKRYRLPAPEVACIRQGKAHRRDEFGVQVSMVTTNRSHFILAGEESR